MKFDFGNANKKQKEAILNTDGPLLIIAGPGTGKTFTLVKKIAYLIVEKNIEPKNILVVTFTEKASKELISRITDELINYNIEIDVNEMYIGTFHQICLKILKEFREETDLGKNYKMMDDFETKYFVYRNINQFEGTEKLFKDENTYCSRWETADRVLKFCSKLIEEIDEPEKLLLDKDKDIQDGGSIVATYKELLKKENALDFSSILSYCYQLLKNNNEIRKIIEDRIKYIIVDEYQDTNKIQEKILFKIMNKNHNICVVGDDDQGLYRFRGATITNLLAFSTNFEEGECKDIILSDNYRSNQKIVDFYNSYMSNPIGFEWESNRFNKKIIASKSDNDKRETVVKCSGDNLDKWYENVLEFINKLKNENVIQDLNQIAFLANSISGDKVTGLINYLESNNVPCYAPRSKQLFERDEIKLLIGSLLIIFDRFNIDNDDNYLNDDFREYYRSCATSVRTLFNTDKKKYAPFINYLVNKNSYFNKIVGKNNMAFSDIVYDLFQFEPFVTFIGTKNLNNVHDERPIRNLSSFIKITSDYERMYNLNFLDEKHIDRHLKTFLSTYLWFLYNGGIGEYEDEKDVSPSGCVTFLTIHQSKGLEFPIVLIDSLGQVPRKNNNELLEKIKNKYIKEKQIEDINFIKFYDFWRLYYTGFSRAENLLVLTCAEDKRTPSKYMRSMYSELNDCFSIDYKGLNINSIKKSNVKDTYSFTSCVEVYNKCPIQYELLYGYDFSEVKKGSKLYGTIVHETIEDIHKAYMSGKGNEVNEEVIKDWFDDNYHTLSKNLFSYLTEANKIKALNEVLKYYRSQSDEFHKLRDAEVEVSLIRDKYIMKGCIDLIKGEGDTVEIVDFKSIKRPDREKDRELLATYKKQLEVYAYLVEKYHNVKVSKLHLYFTSQDSGKSTISFDKDDKSIAMTIQEFDDTVSKIQNNVFDRRCNDLRTCSTCVMHPYCNLRKQ